MTLRSISNSLLFFLSTIGGLLFFKESDLFLSEIRYYIMAFQNITDVTSLFITSLSCTGSSEPGFWLFAFGLLQLADPETTYRIIYGGAIALICFSVSFSEIPMPSKVLTFLLMFSNISFLFLIDDQLRGTVGLAFLIAFLYTGRRGFLFLAPFFHLSLIIFIGCLYFRFRVRYMVFLLAVVVLYSYAMSDLLAAKAVYLDMFKDYSFGFLFYISCILLLCVLFQYKKKIPVALKYPDVSFFVKVFSFITLFAVLDYVIFYDRYYVYMYVIGIFALRYFLNSVLALCLFTPLVPIMVYQTMNNFNDKGLLISIKPLSDILPYLPVAACFFVLFLLLRRICCKNGECGIPGFRKNIFAVIPS